jgi:predicted MFS family arabinose efflux permease
VGQRRVDSLDPAGIVLLGVGVVLLLLPLVQERQWQGQAKWLLVVAAAAVLGLFVWAERRRAARGRPVLVDLALFRHRSYALGTLVGLLYFGGFTAIFFIFTLFLQNGLHYTALGAGIAITPFALGSAAAAALGGRVVTRYGRPLVAAGLCLVVIGLALTMLALHFVPGHQAPFATAAPLLVAGLGSGLVISPNQTLSLAEVPVREGGSAGGVLQTGQRIGAAVGIAAVGSVFFAELSSSGQDWTQAFRSALLVAMALVAISLAAALTDVIIGRRQRSRLS